MRFRDDNHVVHTETIRAGDTEFEIVVRFGSMRIPYGSQTFNGKQGWFCAYIVMDDSDFDRISGKLTFNGSDYPELDVPGGTSFFNKVSPFDKGPDDGSTVIGWDYNHGEPWEKDATLESVLDDARKAVRCLSDLFHE